MKTASVLVILAAVFGVVLGTAFSLAYDMPISQDLALLFGLLGLVLALGFYGLWRLFYRKGAE